jgi:hypothetical protein
MISKAQMRKKLRPHGLVGATCPSCYFFGACGGFQGEGSLYDCFVANCCEYHGKDVSKCNAVCPRKPDFSEWMAELGGRRFDYIPKLTQKLVALPPYIPLIDHNYARRRPLDYPVVALDTYKVMRERRSEKGRIYATIDRTPDGLRSAFGLAPDTKILRRGVAKDPPLERWWENRLTDDAPGQLARLGIAVVVAPNFSHFLDVPRTDNLFNRVRQLICIEELAAAGHCVVPHLSTTTPFDWQYWARFLRENTTVRRVAKEFQTGYRASGQGSEAIDRLARLQDDVQRPLQPLIIGGSQFVELLARRFDTFTLVDSMPFAKAAHRRRFDLTKGRPRWTSSFTARGEGIDDLLADNIFRYRSMIDQRIDKARTSAAGLVR